MKRNSLTIFVGALLVVIFGLLLFTFQVRQTEIALVTTFDKPSRRIEEPGFKWKWPPPIQQVYKFDKRVQTFANDKIDEMLTKDNFNVDVQVYIGWRISQPDLFFSSFPKGTVETAEPALESLIRSAKISVIGGHPFSHFVSTDTNELKLAQVEKEILNAVQPSALSNYGIDVKFVGIKQFKLPESVTQKVFDRMIAERQREIDNLKSQGESQASVIRSAADLERDRLRAKADSQATTIKGQADATAAKSLVVFEQNPELANFIGGLRALEAVTKDRTTLILDERTSPFNLLTRPATNQLPPQPAPSQRDDLSNQEAAPADGKVATSRNNP